MDAATGLSDALVLLFRVAILIGVFLGARALTEGSKAPAAHVYGWAIAVAIGFAALVYGTMGSHVEDADPLFGGGNRVVDYKPTDDEKTGKAIFTGACFGAAAMIGCASGLKRRESPE